MKTLLKVLLTIVAIILLLFILSFITLSYLISSNNIKNMLIRQVNQHTGLQLTIADLKWSLFPTLKIQIDNASLSNAPDFGPTPLATLGHIYAGVKLIPLFHNKVITTGFTVENLTLNLTKNKAGISNWQVFNTNAHYRNAIKNKKTFNKAMATAPAVVFFNSPYITISNININYVNQQTGQHFLLSNADFQANNITNNQFFPFKTSVNFTNQQPYTRIIFHATGQALLDPNGSFLLKNVNLNNSITNQSGTSQLTITNLNTKIHFGQNKIIINPFTATLYGGNLAGKAMIITNAKTTNYLINGQFNTIQAQNLLADLYGYTKFTGVGNVSFNLASSGNTQTAFLQNLDGNGSISLNNAGFLSFDWGYAYRNAMSLLQTGKPLSGSGNSMTKLGFIKANYTITNGIISTNNLTLTTPILEVNGTGSANLNNQQVNLRLIATGVKGSLDNLTQSTPSIPFNVTGTFNSVTVLPDLSGLLTNQLKQQIQNQLSKKLKSLNINNLLGQ
ncbi:MAG: hypothetical protein A3E87_03080 [Gammaproteobacteria bacterium RIFCSPHIGHO2_12_FULL_35_23]|nr:MAG: hypothetical protein A3E87_03080 [Gammaproteobacteria bacterium RIFCSPHIGHO2_12_FULL_35_23]